MISRKDIEEAFAGAKVLRLESRLTYTVILIEIVLLCI